MYTSLLSARLPPLVSATLPPEAYPLQPVSSPPRRTHKFTMSYDQGTFHPQSNIHSRAAFSALHD